MNKPKIRYTCPEHPDAKTLVANRSRDAVVVCVVCAKVLAVVERQDPIEETQEVGGE